ncbi:hypothetical protein UFOVP290_8 [uncultured Caudovirales phage]|uniref:Uncharacterized protein n=1 Tax=uncultured Caudovirales phage TaxID=2100421 RepID=A0A6J5RFI1_9CAUD|nr:hypothetical protein UFOVP290_8 [uncultured Caudovirales phage]CAB4176062.1 hypothetical protein UFOVP982_8 [uncultured Caudovirales phage]CAB4194732.1 hypothetical protein UFOVP1265_2 [uncultured Caudovirales phage]
MAYTAPTVNYCATIGGTYTSLTGIQSVSISRGRQRFQDNFTQTNCVIELIPSATYAVPLAVGQFIDVRTTNAAGSPAYFVGNITDIERQYSIPYTAATGLAPADRITITAAGTLGVLGKSTFADYFIVSSNATETVGQVAFDAGTIVDGVGLNYTSLAFNSAQALTNIGVLDLVNTLLRTAQYFIDDIDNARAAYLGKSNVGVTFQPGQGNTTYTFSDAGTVGALRFNNLQFLSSVQNTFTQAQVAPAGLATQTASSGSAPYNTLVYDTYSVSTADAASLAGYIINLQSTTTAVPFSISTNTNLAPTCTTISELALTGVLSDITAGMNLGATVKVIFRGTTVNATIQGINTTFYPDYATVQLFLSPSLGTAFTLDSTVLGVLDTSRLGFP